MVRWEVGIKFRDVMEVRRELEVGEWSLEAEGGPPLPLLLLGHLLLLHLNHQAILLLNLGGEEEEWRGEAGDVGEVRAVSVGGSPGHSHGALVDLGRVSLHPWEALLITLL